MVVLYVVVVVAVCVCVFVCVCMRGLVDDCMADLTKASGKEDGSDVQKKYVVSEGYMLGETKFIEGIIAGLRAVKGNQCILDAVYDELMTGLKGDSRK